MITPSQAQTSIKNIVGESYSLNPSALITLYEIDVSNLGLEMGVLTSSDVVLKNNTIFRFHNNVNLTTNSIFWRGSEYIAAPIFAQGFEFNLKGANPVPKLSITVSDDGIPLLTALKIRLSQLGNDLCGAMVTRIRTYARFLDIDNFVGGIPPQNFYPDPNAELPRDVYYIDKKSSETKTYIEYELAPLFEVENIKLPARLVSESSCAFFYRGQGCLYEYASRYNPAIHFNGNLPDAAPPVATYLDEQIVSLLSGKPFVDKGQYNPNMIYKMGEFVYINVNGLNYYFTSKIDQNNLPPSNADGWISDECSKTLLGCKIRYQVMKSGVLPFGAFPSVNRFEI